MGWKMAADSRLRTTPWPSMVDRPFGCPPDAPKRSKYGVDNSPAGKAERTRIIDGKPVTFASKREARRYDELKLLERARDITHLELQPVFKFEYEGVYIGRYTGDFRYFDRIRNRRIVEDVKSKHTRKDREYQKNRKLMLAFYKVEVEEVL